MANWILKNKKLIIIASAVFLFGLIFISVPMGIFPDSVGYYKYLHIFLGQVPMSEWWTIRGPGYPILFYFAYIIFNNILGGMLILSYLIFLTLVFVIYFIAKKVLGLLNSRKPVVITTYVLIVLLIVLNPIIFGYFHVLLTEYVVMLLAVLSCLLAWQWIEVDFKSNRRKFLIYGITFILLGAYTWYVKQPYITIAMSPLLIAGIISLVKNRSLYNVIQRLVCIISVTLGVAIFIVSWNVILNFTGATANGLGNQDQFVSRGVYISLTDVRYQQSNGEVIANIGDRHGSVIDKMTFNYSGENPSVSDGIKIWFSILMKHPLVVFDSYLSNYLSAVNVYGQNVSEGVFYPYKHRALYGGENSSIGLFVFSEPDNISRWTPDSQLDENLFLIEYDKTLSLPVFNKLGKLHLGLYIVAFLLLPVFFVCSVIACRRRRRINSDSGQNKTYELVVILLGMTLINIIFNIALGAILDRYVYVTWPAFSLAMVLWLAVIMSRGKFRIRLDSLIASAKNRRKLPR